MIWGIPIAGKKHCLFLRRASPSVASGLRLTPQPWPLGYSVSSVHGHQLWWILQLRRRALSLFRRTDVCVRSCYVSVLSCVKIQSRRDILPRMLLYRLYTVPATAGRLQILNCSRPCLWSDCPLKHASGGIRCTGPSAPCARRPFLYGSSAGLSYNCPLRGRTGKPSPPLYLL